MMYKAKWNADPRESNDVIHLRRNADRPKCKINYGLRRKSSLIEQNHQRRNSPSSYSIREDIQTTWLSNDNEVIGIEKKYIKEMDINLNDIFKVKPKESSELFSDPESQLSNETLKPMERVSVSDVCKVLELQSGLKTANNVRDCLNEHNSDVTNSEVTYNQVNPRRKGKLINEKLFGNDNVNEIDYGQMKKLKGSPRTPGTLSSGRIIRKGLTGMPTKKRDSPRQIFFGKNTQLTKRDAQVDLDSKYVKKTDHKPKETIENRQPIENINQLLEDQMEQGNSIWKMSLLKQKNINENLTKDHKEAIINDGHSKQLESIKFKNDSNQTLDENRFYNQTDTRILDTAETTISFIKRPIVKSACGIIYTCTDPDATKDTSEISFDRKGKPGKNKTKPLEVFPKETCQLKNNNEFLSLEKSRKQRKTSRPVAAIEPKYLTKNNRNHSIKKNALQKYYISFKKNQLPLPKRANILKEPEKAQKIDVNLKNTNFGVPENASSLIPYDMETYTDTNIGRESAMRTSVLVERAQHLHQEYEKRVLIDKYLDSLPEELNEVEAELVQTMCVFPTNRIQEIDRCPCGRRLTHCGSIMSRPAWFYETDSLTKWLLSTPPSVIISIFIICIFSICVLNSENPKPMSTWEYMMSSFKKEVKQPTKTFRSNFF